VGVGVRERVGVTVAVRLGEGEMVGFVVGMTVPQADTSTPRQVSIMTKVVYRR